MTMTGDLLLAGTPEPPGFRRIVTISLALHIGIAAAALLVPREWITGPATPPVLMTISLAAGTEGPRSTGMTPIGGRPVDVIAPQPKRPEPVRPAAAKPDVMTVPVKSVPSKAPAKPSEAPPSSVPRPPTTGTALARGTAAAETGATGQSLGLSFGGGAGGTQTITLADFCCPAYVTVMLEQIRRGWANVQPDRGTTVMKYTILRDGTVTDISVEKSSGSSLLDRASRAALDLFRRDRARPLPPEYTGESLTIYLTFPYGSK
jgi:protein TonB